MAHEFADGCGVGAKGPIGRPQPVIADARWQATVDGVAAPIVRADIMFQAVAVPAGASEVIFRYQPVWLPGAQIAGIVAWLLVLLVAGIIWWRSASKY